MTGYRIVLVSHGNLAASMLEIVEMLMGPQPVLAAYGLQREMTEEAFMGLLRAEAACYGTEHVLFLSDLEYGTPCNSLLLLTKEFPGLHHITGINLAGIIAAVTAAGREGTSIEIICREIMEGARNGLQDMGQILENLQEDIEED